MNKTNDQSYYQTLGIDKNGTEKEIKDAYTRLAEMFRPDKIKEAKGREALYIEKQAWNEILDAYSKALKEVDKTKEGNKNKSNGDKLREEKAQKANENEEDKPQNENDVNNNTNLNDYAKNFKLTCEEKKKLETNSFDKGIESFKKELYEKVRREIYQTIWSKGLCYWWRDLKWNEEFLNCFQNCRRKNCFGDSGCDCHFTIKSTCDNLTKQSICAHTGLENGGHNNHVLNHIEFCLSTPEEVGAFKKKIIEVTRKIVYKGAFSEERNKKLEAAEREYEKEHNGLGSFTTKELIDWYENWKGIKIDEIGISNESEVYHCKDHNKKPDAITNQTNQQETSNNLVISSKNVFGADNKNTLITKLKTEIAELRKNLDPNNAEQKVLLAQKEAQVAELENGQKSQGQNNKSNNPKKNNLTSILLPMGIIFTSLLVVSSAFRIAKKQKNLKRIKAKK